MKRLLIATLILITSHAMAEGEGLFTEYSVKPGESLNDIAKRNGVTWAKLAEDNNLPNPPTVYVGQKLAIMKKMSRKEYESVIAKTRPTCSSKEECDKKMEAAHLWVNKYADYKIRSSNNVLIETYAPREFTGEIIVKVSKEPYRKGTYAIVANMSCNNPNMTKPYDPMTSCKRNVYKEIIKFNDFVSSY
ncbi:LysM domain protein [Acinetobacter baumannii]|uniref:LysM peptidoglycan-binding domain-containing protein n=1 Tax=Acinetobacter baumannii TaxID=470 RepID=UPI000DE5FA45|nr:LysM domain-containing protein [Acinetobacter baumannii]SSP00900.1 LysM domain protein [Acinetobacter baumannii]